MILVVRSRSQTNVILTIFLKGYLLVINITGLYLSVVYFHVFTNDINCFYPYNVYYSASDYSELSCFGFSCPMAIYTDVTVKH